MHPDLHGAGLAREGVAKRELEAAVAVDKAQLLVVVRDGAVDFHWIDDACEERPTGMVRGEAGEEGICESR